MDFGLVGLDGLVVGSESGFGSLVSESETRNKSYGSGLFKQERSAGSSEDDWRSLKMARTEDFSGSKAMLAQQRTSPLLRSTSMFSEGQMLSFSNPNESALPYYHHALAAYNRSAGLGSGSLNTSMHGALAGVRGPFTPSQWMELEHQALIYKYINANVPIPSNLLLPIRKALNPSGFTGFAGSLRPNPLGWGAFHLGFSGNNDPEPGRCRRTDGKKWRCSRDAVADQKYCERHMNRGRHRSRKPVEGQSGHAAAGQATAKVMPLAPLPASVASGDGASSSLNVSQHQVKTFQTGVINPSAHSEINRILLTSESVGGRLHDSHGSSMISPTMTLKPKDNPFSILKQQFSCEDSPRTQFGLVSDSFLNSSQRDSYLNCRTYGTSSDLNNRESKTQDPLRHFIDDWPKNRSNSSSIGWPDVGDTQLDRTQLSISIPMSSDFSSSTSSPSHEKVNLSPLRLSRECNPIQMGLGVGNGLNEPTQRQANWIPISWESSVGGPLGEVLNNTSSTSGDCKISSSALNLMTEGWDASPNMELSPTGVLQKTAFGSLSNSSTGSSPRTETNFTYEGASLCDNLLGPTRVHSSSIPSL